MTTAFSAAAGWTLFVGLTLALGSLAVRWLVLPGASGASEEMRASLEVDSARIGSVASLILLVGIVLYFVRQLGEFRDPFVPWTEEADLLLGATAWGRAWLFALAGSLIATAGLLTAASGRRLGWWLAAPAILALGTFPGFTGHAAGLERLRALGLLGDSVHVWAAGGWVGGLATLLILDWMQKRRGEGSAHVLACLVPAFSRIAFICVGALTASGMAASWTHLPSLSALLTTGYGRALSLKLVLVGIVLCIGGLNYRVVTPRLGTTEGDSTMRKAATLELVVAQIVLFVTAILVRTSPTGH